MRDNVEEKCSGLLKNMFVVRFSDKVEFNFTESQIKLIPYFKTMIESDFKTDFQISQASIGFEYLHIYATLDEIDITDPHDRYLFVLKQCDFFCYDKLKELVERKYGFRTDVSEVKDKIGKLTKCDLTYLSSMKLTKAYIYPYNYQCTDHMVNSKVNIEPFYEPPTYSTDPDINNLFVERYKKDMEEYYFKLFSEIFTEEIKNISVPQNRKNNIIYKKYTVILTTSPWCNPYYQNAVGSVEYALHLIKPKYTIRILNNVDEFSNKFFIYQIYTSDIFQ